MNVIVCWLNLISAGTALINEVLRCWIFLPTTPVVTWVAFTAAFMCLFVCLFVCLFFRTMSQKPMQLGSLNLKQKCSTTSPENPFILGSKGQGHETQKTLLAWVRALLWVRSSSIFWFVLFLICVGGVLGVWLSEVIKVNN